MITNSGIRSIATARCISDSTNVRLDTTTDIKTNIGGRTRTRIRIRVQLGAIMANNIH